MTANPNLAVDQKSLGKQGAFIEDSAFGSLEALFLNNVAMLDLTAFYRARQRRVSRRRM